MLGLDHSDVEPAITSADPYNSYDYQRTLRDKDVAACTKLYGKSLLSLTNRTLNWAKAFQASALKGGPVVTREGNDGFGYHYYPASNSTARVKNGIVWYMGPDSAIQDMGPPGGYTFRGRRITNVGLHLV